MGMGDEGDDDDFMDCGQDATRWRPAGTWAIGRINGGGTSRATASRSRSRRARRARGEQGHGEEGPGCGAGAAACCQHQPPQTRPAGADQLRRQGLPAQCFDFQVPTPLSIGLCVGRRKGCGTLTQSPVWCPDRETMASLRVTAKVTLIGHNKMKEKKQQKERGEGRACGAAGDLNDHGQDQAGVRLPASTDAGTDFSILSRAQRTGR